MSRYMRIRMTPESVLMILTRQKTIIEVDKPLPSDIKVIDIQREWYIGYDIYWFILESKEFENIPEGGMIPELASLTINMKEEI